MTSSPAKLNCSFLGIAKVSASVLQQMHAKKGDFHENRQ
jgi:hypothetical protein